MYVRVNVHTVVLPLGQVMNNCGWHITLLRLSAGFDRDHLQGLLAEESRAVIGTSFEYRLHPVHWVAPDRFVQFHLSGPLEDRVYGLRQRLSRAFRDFVVEDNRGSRSHLDVPVLLR